jgi:1,6-anhydro-N-acetylmuramate kinase
MPQLGTCWSATARTWRWRERADAYDDTERVKDLAVLEEAKRQARERRFAVLQGTAGKMAGVLNARGAELAIRPTDAARLLLACQVELRKELDDEPRRRVVHAGDPEAPIGYKVYLVDPSNPASPEDL